MTRIVGESLVGLCAAFALACPSKAPPKKPPAVPNNELAKLPPSFKLDLPTAKIVPKRTTTPERFADGSLSVQGILQRREELQGKDLSLTAYVVKIHLPTEKECEKGCTPPHLYVADAPETEDAASMLLIADFDAAQVSGLSKGSRATFEGSFVRKSRSRFARPEGLLALRAARLAN